MALKEKVTQLNERILQGDILGAFEDYYAEDVVMQDNNTKPRVGKQENREYEKQFVESIKDFHGAEIKSMATNEEEGVATVEWTMDFTFQNGQRAQRNQVSVQKWENGQIVKERFYYGE